MRNQFDRQLDRLHTELMEMGILIEHAIGNACDALMTQSRDKAMEAMAYEEDINRKERDIEALCLRLLLQRQPVARDLRQISAALKMITDMERIGDQASDIAEIVVYLTEDPLIQEPKAIRQMAVETAAMVKSSLDAFVRSDLRLAGATIAQDDVVDDLFTQVKTELMQLILLDRENGGQAMDLLMIAKYFERIGDHAVNIAEWVEFSITGKHKGDEV